MNRATINPRLKRREFLLALALLAILAISAGQSLTPKAQPLQGGPEALEEGLLYEPGEHTTGESAMLNSVDLYMADRYGYPTGKADRTWLLEAARQDKKVPASVPAGQVIYDRENSDAPLALDPSRWTSIGPQPQESNTCQAPCFTFNEVAGRTNDFVIDPISPTIAYLASDGGGVWKSTNCCSPTMTWSPVTDDPLISTVSIGDLSIDKTTGTVYAGTGDLRFGSFSFGSAGILKSTDRGATWQVKGAEVFSPYYPQQAGRFPQYNSVGKVEPDPNNSNTIVAGSKLGVYLSYNGGDTWAGPCLPDPYPAQRQDITGLVLRDDGATTTIFAAVGARGYSTTVQYNLAENGANGVYKASLPASGCPANWSLASRPNNGWPEGTGSGVPVYQAGGDILGRIDMAIAPSNPNYLYAYVQAIVPGQWGAVQRGGMLGIWRSTDGGTTWVQRTNAEDLEAAQDLCGGTCVGDLLGVCGDYAQNWYDQNIIVDPNNPDVIFFQNHNIWKSTDGGATVRDTTCGYSTLSVPRPVHVDNHALCFMPGSSSVLLAGSDGGAYITMNADTPQPLFTNLNSSLSTIEFYSGDITADFANSASQGAVAGAQDNGSSVWSGDATLGPRVWRQRKGGDGMYARLEPVLAQRWYMEAQNGALQVTNGGPDGPLVDAAGGWGADAPRLSFVFPYEIYKGVPALTPGGGEDCPVTGCVHMIGGSYRVWETIQGGVPASSWYANSPDLTKGTLADRSFINQLAFAPRTDDLAIVGTNDGNVWYGFGLGQGTANTATWVNVTGGNTVLPNRPTLDVATDPNNPLIGYAAVGGFDQNTPGSPGHLFQVTCTANCASFAWVNKSGNLPNIPANSVMANPRFRQQVFVGTDWGVYYTNNIDATTPVWARFNAGMPNVMVWDMAIDRGFTTLALFTRSRGVFVWPLPSAPFAPPTPTGTPPTATPTAPPTNTVVVPPSNTPAGTNTPTPTATFTHTATSTPTPLGCGATQPLHESFESGYGSFTPSNAIPAPVSSAQWDLVTDAAYTGNTAAKGPDPNEQSDMRLTQNSPVAIPAGASEAYFRFAHRYSFEAPDFDGAVLEYSTNGGVMWVDAAPLITQNGYTGVITGASGNPLAARPAWVNQSAGYPAFQVVNANLLTLAGQSVQFRFRSGSDLNTGAAGWWIDEVFILVAEPCVTPGPSPTATATPGSVLLVGHVLWEDRGTQPEPRQAMPITLTLSSGSNGFDYPQQTTDLSGFFTVPVASLPGGTYTWRVQGPDGPEGGNVTPGFLSNSGTLTLTGAPIVSHNMGLMRGADANNDNLVDVLDFNILKPAFGTMPGDPGYDNRADFNGDNVVEALDFNVLKRNFGISGD